jgi:proteasome-associated ATPase
VFADGFRWLPPLPVRTGAARRGWLDTVQLDAGQTSLVDRRQLARPRPRTDVTELTLEEIPDVTFADIGGLATQLRRDAVELPFRHRELFGDPAAAAQGGPAVRSTRVR